MIGVTRSKDSATFGAVGWYKREVVGGVVVETPGEVVEQRRLVVFFPRPYSPQEGYVKHIKRDPEC